MNQDANTHEASSTGGTVETKKCPHCGAEIKKMATVCRYCGKNVAGSESVLVACKECGSLIHIPQRMLNQSLVCPMCGEEFSAVPAESKICPKCGESIKIAAQVCKFCHSPQPPVRPLKFGREPKNAIASSIQLPVPDAVLREEMAAKWKSLKLWTILSVPAVVGDLLLAINIGIPILIFSIVAVIFSVIRFCQLFYRYWSYIGPEKGYTPGQMVGFSFIPIFHLYWIFQLYWKLAKRLNEAGDRQVNPGLALTYCILFCCSVIIPYIDDIVFIIVFIPEIIIFFLLHSALNRAFTGGE